MKPTDVRDDSARRAARRLFRFGPFTLSPARRVLLMDGVEVPVIPRYFDLLLLLVEQRERAVSRSEILDSVWTDVVVSDGALSQAIRTLRRTLGDDPREPRFIRTVSRHGYRFVHADVVEMSESGSTPEAGAAGLRQQPEQAGDEPPGPDRLESALAALLGARDDAARRDAAETLHALGTAEALRRLDRRPGHQAARALLRDARWDVPGAGDVPIAGQPGALGTTAHLVRLRLGRALTLAGGRWLAAVAGSGLAGVVAGFLGGAALMLGPGSTATAEVLVGLPLVGLLAGALGAFGVGGGLAVAETVFRSVRAPAMVALGGLGGGAVGLLAHAFGGWTLQGLFGADFSPMTGGFEGLVLGCAAGLGYALATWRTEGMAAPRGPARRQVVVVAGTVTAISAAALAWSGHSLGAMSLDLVARAFPGSQVSLDPLARLLGERHAGPWTGAVIGALEGFFFAGGLVLGLTRRGHVRQ